MTFAIKSRYKISMLQLCPAYCLNGKDLGQQRMSMPNIESAVRLLLDEHFQRFASVTNKDCFCHSLIVTCPTTGDLPAICIGLQDDPDQESGRGYFVLGLRSLMPQALMEYLSGFPAHVFSPLTHSDGWIIPLAKLYEDGARAHIPEVVEILSSVIQHQLSRHVTPANLLGLSDTVRVIN